MEQLQVREKEIFETLKKIRKFVFVVLGGYAVNAYALPRFSVDCDIAVKDKEEAEKIGDVLTKIGYSSENACKDSAAYHGNFERFEKKIAGGFRVSIDIMIENVIDRQTGVVFSAGWIFDNSGITTLKGKTIVEELKVRIINIDSLFVMKFISCRSTDIRDIFMLGPHIKDREWVKEEISKRYNLNERLLKIKEKVTNIQFKNNLEGVYGYIDNKIFEKHKKALLGLREKE